MTPREIVETVRELEHASTQLVGWLKSGGFCCPNVPRVHGYCTRKACIGRREHAAVLHAIKAAHCANQLVSIAEVVTELVEA